MTEQQAEQLMEDYWSAIATMTATNDIHQFATLAWMVDEIAQVLNEYTEDE